VSRFEAREGVNFVAISEEELAAAGAKVAGPAVVVSLSPEDVSVCCEWSLRIGTAHRWNV
jgi:hypothetical protein